MSAYVTVRSAPHACISRQLALIEMQLVVTGLLSRFAIESEVETIDDLRLAGVLQPRGEVTATLNSS